MHGYRIAIVTAALIAFVAGCALIWMTFSKRPLRNDGGGDAGGGPNPFNADGGD